MGILVIGPAVLTVVSWVHSLLAGSIRPSTRRAGWAVGVAMAPASAVYSGVTGQWPYIAGNTVFLACALRGLTVAHREVQAQAHGGASA